MAKLTPQAKAELYKKLYGGFMNTPPQTNLWQTVTLTLFVGGPNRNSLIHLPLNQVGGFPKNLSVPLPHKLPLWHEPNAQNVPVQGSYNYVMVGILTSSIGTPDAQMPAPHPTREPMRIFVADTDPVRYIPALRAALVANGLPTDGIELKGPVLDYLFPKKYASGGLVQGTSAKLTHYGHDSSGFPVTAWQYSDGEYTDVSDKISFLPPTFGQFQVGPVQHYVSVGTGYSGVPVTWSAPENGIVWNTNEVEFPAMGAYMSVTSVYVLANSPQGKAVLQLPFVGGPKSLTPTDQLAFGVGALKVLLKDAPFEFMAGVPPTLPKIVPPKPGTMTFPVGGSISELAIGKPVKDPNGMLLGFISGMNLTTNEVTIVTEGSIGMPVEPLPKHVNAKAIPADISEFKGSSPVGAVFDEISDWAGKPYADDYYLNTSTAWAAPDANPLKDIQDMLTKMKKQGYSPAPPPPLKMSQGSLDKFTAHVDPAVKATDQFGASIGQVFGVPIEVDNTVPPNMVQSGDKTYSLTEKKLTSGVEEIGQAINSLNDSISKHLDKQMLFGSLYSSQDQWISPILNPQSIVKITDV